MNVIADLCVVPIGVGVSVSKYVAACERVLTAAGLKTKLQISCNTFIKPQGWASDVANCGDEKFPVRWGDNSRLVFNRTGHFSQPANYG